MKEDLITFKTAKLAKEKMFDLATYTAYIGGKFHENEDEPNGYDGYDLASKENWNKKGWIFTKDGKACFGCQNNPKYFEAYTVTTQSLLQKWLREKKGIVVVVFIDDNQNTDGVEYYSNVYSNNGLDDYFTSVEFKGYEEALEEGLQESLKLIK